MPSPNRRAATGLILSAALAGCAGPRLYSDTPVKIGAPYQVAGRWYVPADDPRYAAVGYASWYGREHKGGRTARGETFDPKRISAAHPTLPLPSYIEVTALDSGRRIIVRVNDRGPFSRQRIVDLSQASAERLGVRRGGQFPVAIRRVYPSDADRGRLRAGKPAADLPDASRDDLAMLRERLAGYGAAASAGLSQPPRD